MDAASIPLRHLSSTDGCMHVPWFQILTEEWCHEDQLVRTLLTASLLRRLFNIR